MGDSEDEFRQQRRRRRGRPEGRRGASGGAGSPSAGPAPVPPSLRGGGGPGRALLPEEAASSSASSSPRCPLCRQDLSALDPLRRQRHVDGCLDELEGPRPPPPSECPARGKSSGSLRSRGGPLKRCAAGMGAPSAAAAKEPPRGLKRSSASSVEPSTKKCRVMRGTDEDLLVALAMSRSLVEGENAKAKHLHGELSRRKGPREGKRRRPKAPRSPPPLLLQDPGKACQDMEDRVALLLFPEVGEFPSTPPLPASLLLQAQQSRGAPQRLPGSLWELSSLTGGSLPGSFGDMGISQLPLFPEQSFGPDALFLQSGPVALLGMGRMPPEPGPSQSCGHSDQSREIAVSRRGVEGTLQDLVELAGEGLTLTQWNLEVWRQEGSGQERVAPGDAPQKIPVCSQEEERESPGGLRQTLSSLAAAFGTMVNNPHLSDVQFQVDSGEIFYAHLFVLYARCPQLLEEVDRIGFTVAEDGGAGTRRVLLGDIPPEAVVAFLTFLYAADFHFPRHLQSDVGALATRFGVWDLAALCGSHLDLRVSRETKDGRSDGGGDVDGKDRAEAFEELLESMWLDADEEAVLKYAHQEGNSSETVGEQELREIYDFAATQHLSATRAGEEEEEEEEEGCHKGKQSQGGRWAGCSLTSLRKGLGDPAAVLGTAAGLEPPTLPSHPNAGQEGGPQRVSFELQQKQLWQPLVVPSETSVRKGCLESPPSLAEGRGYSPEPRGAGSSASSGKALQPAWKMFPRDSLCEPLVLARPPRESVPVPSAQQRAAMPRNHVPRSCASCSSASLPGPTRGSSSQTALEAPCSGQGEPPCGARPQPGNPDRGPIVVLDSDEEWDFGASLGGGPGTSGQCLGVSRCLGLSPHPQQCSSDEEGGGKGGKTLVPDTPLPSRPNAGASLVPGPDGQLWAGESWVRSSPERPSPGDPLPVSCGPLSSPLRSPGSSPPCLQNEVVVIDDSAEESPAEEGASAWQRAAATAEGRRTNSQPGSHPGAVGADVGSPLAAGGHVAERVGPGWTGGAGDDSDGSDILPLTQRSPYSPAVPTQTLNPARQLEERALPVTPMPSYSVMATPELKKELKRFGVRALPKRQMVLKLKEIFQFTHQGRDTESMGRAPAALAGPLRESQQMVGCQGNAQGIQRRGFPGASEQPKRGTALPAAGLALGTNGGDGGRPLSPPASQESTGSSGAGSEVSVLSHSSPSTEFETSLLAAEEAEAVVPASQAAAREQGKLEAFRCYIHSTPALCRQILLYQPIELAVLQAELKQNGVRIGLGKLLDFLDAHGITFTTAEARREKHHHSQQSKKRRGRQPWC